METCSKCGKEVLPENSCHHLVRQGYSLKHFPILQYEKLQLCPDCLGRQKRVDLIEKVAAIIGLIIVLYFMVMGVLLLFGFAGE